jgi:hypothetical protein
MSQLTHPIVTFRAHRVVVLSALLALAATTAIVLVLAIGGSYNDASDASVTPANPTAQPGLRYDGGPEEGSSAGSFQPQQLRYDGGPEEGTAAQTFGQR